MSDSTMFVCENIGVSGSTPCHVRLMSDGRYEARMGFALMGSTQMNEADFKACSYNPFHDEFYDNAVSGIGDTKDDAIAAMKNDLKGIADSFWF